MVVCLRMGLAYMFTYILYEHSLIETVVTVSMQSFDAGIQKLLVIHSSAIKKCNF